MESKHKRHTQLCIERTIETPFIAAISFRILFYLTVNSSHKPCVLCAVCAVCHERSRRAFISRREKPTIAGELCRNQQVSVIQTKQMRLCVYVFCARIYFYILHCSLLPSAARLIHSSILCVWRMNKCLKLRKMYSDGIFRAMAFSVFFIHSRNSFVKTFRICAGVGNGMDRKWLGRKEIECHIMHVIWLVAETNMQLWLIYNNNTFNRIGISLLR